MGNCLVTKLKGVVDNDNLIKFGEVKATFIRGIALQFNKPWTAEIISGNNTFTDGTTKKTFEASAEETVAFTDTTVATEVKLMSKYDITSLIAQSATLNIDDFKYSPLTTVYLNACNISGNPGELITENITTYTVNSYETIFTQALTISDLIPKINSSITSVNLHDLGSRISHTENDLLPISRLLGVTFVDFWLDYVNGSIESLVQAWRANGRTTGENVIFLMHRNNYITFNGDLAGRTDQVGSPVNISLSWDATTITWDGVTITA